MREGRWCPDHQRAVEKRYDPAYDRERGTSSRRGYGARWRRLRGMFLGQHPLCADPFNAHDGRPVAATDVDHIVARARGGTDAFENLQSLCHACHSRKTAVSDGRWESRGMGGQISVAFD